MIEFEEQKLKLQAHEAELKALGEALGLEQLKTDIEQLEQRTAQPGFWDDQQKSGDILKQLSAKKAKIENFDSLNLLYDDTLTLIELANEEEDLSLLEEITTSIEEFEQKLSEATLSTLLTGEYDTKNAILTFHAGAGGTEAQDWNEMLVRMYTRWGERHGFSVKMLDFLDGEEAGLKSAVLLVEGLNAYGYLRCETGVHRLVRVSPFDSSGRRHTSFASLEVMPEIDDDVEIDIRPEDLKVDTYRSGGAGGQHVNKPSLLFALPTFLPELLLPARTNAVSTKTVRLR